MWKGDAVIPAWAQTIKPNFQPSVVSPLLPLVSARSLLFLTGTNLTGCIPSELGLLGSLRRLNLVGNDSSKPIPSGLFSAMSLVSLGLFRNSLSGPILTQIKNLCNLAHLDLSSNSLNASLSEALAELGSLFGTLNQPAVQRVLWRGPGYALS